MYGTCMYLVGNESLRVHRAKAQILSEVYQEHNKKGSGRLNVFVQCPLGSTPGRSCRLSRCYQPSKAANQLTYRMPH